MLRTGASKRIQSARDRLEDGVTADDLTDRQAEVLSYVLQCWMSGFIPTFREIGTQFEIASPRGVMGHVEALQAKGYLEKEDAKSSLIIADKALELVL